jgi:hypothetical protein
MTRVAKRSRASWCVETKPMLMRSSERLGACRHSNAVEQTEVNEVKESGAYCDATAAANLAFVAEVVVRRDKADADEKFRKVRSL